jgi:hypothetical protein
MYPIPQMLDPPGQPIHGIVPPPLVKIVGRQFMVWGIPTATLILDMVI